MAATDIAVVGYAQTPSSRRARESEAQLLVPIVTDPPWEVGPVLPSELGVVLFAHADMTRATAETIQTNRTLLRDIFAILPPSGIVPSGIRTSAPVRT